MSNTYVVIIILLSAAVTFGLRALPFALFGRGKTVPPIIKKLGDLLPYAVIAALVVYCLKDVTTFGAVDNAKILGASAAVVVTHLWKRNTILSITVGTVLYMILLHI